MSEAEINRIIADKINYYLTLYNKTQGDLADYIGVSQATVSNWCKGIKMPRMDKIDKICAFFKIKRSDLMEDHSNYIEKDYYLNQETRQIAQEIYDNPDMRSLFDMSRKMTPERLRAHIALMKQLMGDDKE